MILIFTIIFVSLIFLGIAFGINKKNAKYLLAGYNTMSMEQREKFDIEGFNACKSGIKKAEDEISNIESKQSMLDKQIEENDALILNTFFTLETNLKSASSVSYKIITE